MIPKSERTPSLRVLLRTPSRVLLDMPASEVEADDLAGRFVLRADGGPVLTALVPGEILLRRPDGSELCARVGYGSCTKVGDQVRLVVEHAELDACEPLRMPLAV